MLLKKLLRTQSGMSFVEVMMTAGLLSIAAMGIFTLSEQIQNSSQKSQGLLAKTHFTAALGAYLNSGQGCADLKTGRIAGQAFDNTPSEISLASWNYMGNTNIRAGKDSANKYYVNIPNFSIEELKAYIQPPTSTPSKIKSKDTAGADVDLVRSTITVVAKFKVQNNTYEHMFNVPVLVGDTGSIQNIILHCSDERTVAESCATMKGVYNPNSKNCELHSGCILRDTYQDLIGPDTRLGGPKPNKFTGTNSCPSGSSAVLTHTANWTTTASCGKKCTYPQSNTKNWYSCMSCP